VNFQRSICRGGEVFADRRYREDGSLMPRTEPGALITDIETAVAQTMQLISNKKIETICIHGDGPKAAAMLSAIREAMGQLIVKA
jgi:5-oxoprolinase (ATP-hydrolysing) subunit A